MPRRLKIIVSPDNIPTSSEELLHDAALNAFVVQKSFFSNHDNGSRISVQMVVLIETEEEEVSQAQRAYLRNLRQEGVIVDCEVTDLASKRTEWLDL